MDSKHILNAIRRKYPDAAIVPELSIEDYDLWDEPDLQGSPRASRNRPPDHKFMRRIDALMFESLVRTAIEIKVSKADFKRDGYWKRRMWQRVTHRFVYVVPEGLEVRAPRGCGLWVVNEVGALRVVTKATINKTPEPLPQTVVQRLAYRAMCK